MEERNKLEVLVKEIKKNVKGTKREEIIGKAVTIYGGIQLSQNVISFLKLPARMRIYGNIDRVTGQKKTEEFAAGQCWEVRSNIEINRTGMTSDQIRAEKDKEYQERRPFTNIELDMTKCRFTDLLSCKDLIMPGSAEL